MLSAFSEHTWTKYQTMPLNTMAASNRVTKPPDGES